MNKDFPDEIIPVDKPGTNSFSISNIPIKSHDIRKTKRGTRTSEKKKFFVNHEKEIADRESHDDILKLVIFPFIKNSSMKITNDKPTESGYQLYSCDPFHEEGIKNFDCLIYKEDSRKIVLVFIEVKLGLNSNTILKEFKEKIEEVERYKSKIKEIFSNYEKIITEYVLCVDAIVVDSLKPIFEKEVPLDSYRMILWQIGSLRPTKKLNLICPSESVKSTNAHKYIHSEKEFNNYLRRGVDLVSEGPINFFPLSHPVTKLKAFLIFIKSRKALNRMESESRNYFFTSDDLKNYCDHQLLNQSPAIKERIFSGLVDIILKIDLVKRLNDGFIIHEKYQNRSLHADKMEKLWIESKFQDLVYQKSNKMSLDKFISTKNNADIKY